MMPVHGAVNDVDNTYDDYGYEDLFEDGAKVNLYPEQDYWLGGFSGGEQQQIACAQSALNVPDGSVFWELPLEHYLGLCDTKGYTYVASQVRVLMSSSDKDVSIKARALLQLLSEACLVPCVSSVQSSIEGTCDLMALLEEKGFYVPGVQVNEGECVHLLFREKDKQGKVVVTLHPEYGTIQGEPDERFTVVSVATEGRKHHIPPELFQGGVYTADQLVPLLESIFIQDIPKYHGTQGLEGALTPEYGTALCPFRRS